MRIDRSLVKSLIEQGLSDKEIADKLNCGVSYIRNIRLGEFHIKKLSLDDWRKVVLRWSNKGLNSGVIILPKKIFLEMFKDLFKQDKKKIKLLWRVWPSYNDYKVEISFKIDSGLHCSDDGLRVIPKRESTPGQPCIASIGTWDDISDNSISLPTLDKWRKSD